MPEIGEEPFNAFLGVPILHQGRVLGVLVVQQREPRKFDESEEAFLVTLSAQLATSVAHAEAVGSSMVADSSISPIEDGHFKGLPARLALLSVQAWSCTRLQIWMPCPVVWLKI